MLSILPPLTPPKRTCYKNYLLFLLEHQSLIYVTPNPSSYHNVLLCMIKSIFSLLFFFPLSSLLSLSPSFIHSLPNYEKSQLTPTVLTFTTDSLPFSWDRLCSMLSQAGIAFTVTLPVLDQVYSPSFLYLFDIVFHFSLLKSFLWSLN